MKIEYEVSVADDNNYIIEWLLNEEETRDLKWAIVRSLLTYHVSEEFADRTKILHINISIPVGLSKTFVTFFGEMEIPYQCVAVNHVTDNSLAMLWSVDQSFFKGFVKPVVKATLRDME